MLAVWQHSGRNLSSLMRLFLNQTTNEIYLLIPGYRCNNWYQLGCPYTSYSEAFATYGGLLDKLNTAKQSPAEKTTAAA